MAIVVAWVLLYVFVGSIMNYVLIRIHRRMPDTFSFILVLVIWPVAFFYVPAALHEAWKLRKL